MSKVVLAMAERKAKNILGECEVDVVSEIKIKGYSSTFENLTKAKSNNHVQNNNIKRAC